MDVIRPKSIYGWLSTREDATLFDVNRSVDIAKGGSKWKRMAAFL
jgi:manganese transport protein